MIFCGFKLRLNVVLLISLMLVACTKEPQHITVSNMDNVVLDYMDEHEYVGLAITAKQGGNLVFNRAYGYGDLDKKTKFTSQSVISLGSNIKTLTAAAILLLQEKELLSLSDTVDAHLKFDLKHGNKITLEDLLCHRSDLDDVYGGRGFSDYIWQEAFSETELLVKLSTSQHQPEVGQHYRYNNTGYLLLGQVIKDVTKQSLNQFFKENIFAPTSSTQLHVVEDADLQIMAPAFENTGLVITGYESPVNYRITGGAGGYVGNLESHMTLFREVFVGDLLSEKSKNTMINACVNRDGEPLKNNLGQFSGLGLEIFSINDEMVYTRGGALNGYVSTVFYFPQRDLTVGIAGNTWAPLASLLHKLFKAGWHDSL